jgi:N-acetylglucosamine kinase-like BadF-type ATPase
MGRVSRRTVLAVDGGNSKTDVALVAENGALLAAARGPTSSHQAVGLVGGMERLAALVAEATAEAGSHGRDRPVVGGFALAGADTQADLRLLTRALADRGFAATDVLRNDTLGVLRAGTDRGWGVALICGAGVNAAGLAPDGRTARLDALGEISGDWGGGTDVGWAGLAAAVRARDGRGDQTVLERLVPAHFGLATPRALTQAFYDGRLAEARIRELSPVVFDAATDSDPVARAIVDRLADELVAMARAMLRRLKLTRLDPDVVLGGGVFRATDAGFYERLEAGIAEVAPRARLVRPLAPPVAGAALLALDALAEAPVGGPVARRVRDELRAWDVGAAAAGR